MEADYLEEYEVFREKYGLPNIDELSRDFDVEKLDDRNYFFLLKEIRKIMDEKVHSYLQLFEGILNPNSSPLFVYSFLKGLEESDLKRIRNLYNKLAKIHLKVIRLDCCYEEEGEARFIRDCFEEWQKLKKDILGLVSVFEKDFVEKGTKNNDYFY